MSFCPAVLLLLTGIAGSCHVGSYLLERREEEGSGGDRDAEYPDGKQHGAAYRDEKQYGGTGPAKEVGGIRAPGGDYAAPETKQAQLNGGC